MKCVRILGDLQRMNIINKNGMVKVISFTIFVFEHKYILLIIKNVMKI